MTGDLVVRTATRADVAAIEAMHAACTLESRIARWHAPLRAVPTAYLGDAVSGRCGHIALVAVAGSEVVALASAVHVGGRAWDLGVLVRDDHQRRGLGSQLITALAAAAARRGAATLRADLTPSRRFLLGALQRFGRVLATVDGDGVHARVELAVTTPYLEVVAVGTSTKR